MQRTADFIAWTFRQTEQTSDWLNQYSLIVTLSYGVTVGFYE